MPTLTHLVLDAHPAYATTGVYSDRPRAQPRGLLRSAVVCRFVALVSLIGNSTARNSAPLCAGLRTATESQRSEGAPGALKQMATTLQRSIQDG